MNAEEKLLDAGYEDVKYLVNFSYDDALIGVSHDGRAIYDYDKMIETLMKKEGWTYEDSADWVNYNTIRALPYMGSDSPIVMYKLEDYD